MITNANLNLQTRKELAELAKNYGVAGWHAMKKDDLVSEIRKVQRRLRRKAATESKQKELVAKKKEESAKPKSTTSQPDKTSTNPRLSAASSSTIASSPAAKRSPSSRPASSRHSASRARNRRTPSRNDAPLPELSEPKISAKTLQIRAEMRRRRELMQKHKDLSTSTLVAGSAVAAGVNRQRVETPHRDRIVLLVRDSYWLQASWEITQQSVQRAQSALAERWHTAVPTLRLLAVGDVASNRAETVSRDISIHGGVSNWYIDVQDPPSRYRVAIGYLAANGEFHCLCRSNIVETPVPGDCERLDEHWEDIAEDYERIYALSGGLESSSGELREAFEEKLQRRMPQVNESGSMTGDPSLLRQMKLRLDVDAELIIFGKTDPTASVMVSGHPVKLQSDGAFTVRMELPDKRQVLPVTAETRDGLRQRTTVIAVERNTKTMDTVELHENN
ncbi:DUF4912 domain-containing protein [Neorhodopirellula pilleata]|uniref:Rho termination factor-like N-terminal domain-containing protein n=1 Tax=Neorhodopirellula pilleata TaxID=2714738 RepID=A0A5C6A6L5_9BACT|nr:DUF4912 domain-containing protein [Neorhodopirellula pilleata]TWT95040.1 hypothetical protein Pla100_36190 [Neorhodopirellula pilleata]